MKRSTSGARNAEPMSRLYVLETMPSLAGAMADHRYALPSAELEDWLLRFATAPDAIQKTIAADLAQNQGLIVAGEALAPWAHALVHRLNRRLGAPVSFVEPADGFNAGSTAEPVPAMRAGEVELLVMLEGNPAYDAPADLGFGDALAKVPLSVHLGLYFDETSAAATWHLPATHFMEHWSDARAFDGTASIVQPLIAPLYGGTSPHELVSLLAREPAKKPYQLVLEYWRRASGAKKDFEAFWSECLRKGVVPDSAFRPVVASIRDFPLKEMSSKNRGFAVRFVPDQSVRDGAFANNAWLQELPRSHSKLTWDNAAYVAPGLARELQVGTGDLVEVSLDGRSLRAPVWVLPGHAERTITLPLGYGRRRAGRVGSGVGFDAYVLRESNASWSAEGATLRKTGARHAFASTQEHSRMEGRDLARVVFHGQQPSPEEAKEASLHPDWPYDSYRWAMAIDLNACIGCNACTIACQAENNIPTVGKEQVIAGREMHWIRVDRYYEAPEAAPRTLFQPVPCMHCEKAPCEQVCPVGATLHDSE